MFRGPYCRAARLSRLLYVALVTLTLGKFSFFHHTTNYTLYFIRPSYVKHTQHRTATGVWFEHVTAKTKLGAFYELCIIFNLFVLNLAVFFAPSENTLLKQLWGAYGRRGARVLSLKKRYDGLSVMVLPRTTYRFTVNFTACKEPFWTTALKEQKDGSNWPKFWLYIYFSMCLCITLLLYPWKSFIRQLVDWCCSAV